MTRKSRHDEIKNRWERDPSGRLVLRQLTWFNVALLGDDNCAIRMEYTTDKGEGGEEGRSLQLSLPVQIAHKIGEKLSIAAHYGAKTDPRLLVQSLSALSAQTSPSPYPGVGKCIYCGATYYSQNRQRLGEEHIIPFSLNGDLVLPDAACAKCEGDVNKFEQFCHKKMFGPLRYHLGLATRRPNERPTTLPLDVTIGGEKLTRHVPLDNAPAMLFMPLFDLPDICRDREPEERNIYTQEFWHKQLPPVAIDWAEKNNAESVRSFQATVEGIRFGLLIAKIAHAYAMAECRDEDNFAPLLAPLILKKADAPPLAYLVGGERVPEPPGVSLHELQLIRRRTRKHALIIARVRLFSVFGAPTYYAVVAAQSA